MKNIKVLASIAALATVSCMAAVSASAASSLEFELDAAKSNATTKVVNVNFVTDEYTDVKSAIVDIAFGDAIDPSTVTVESAFATTDFYEFDGQIWEILLDHGVNVITFKDSLTVATLTIPAADFDAAFDYICLTANNNSLENDVVETGAIAVADAEEVAFETVAGDAAKAFYAEVSGTGTLTWNLTDGNGLVKKSEGTEVSGYSDVKVGLVAEGNVDAIKYVAVTID